jgi:hypothetical protein
MHMLIMRYPDGTPSLTVYYTLRKLEELDIIYVEGQVTYIEAISNE